MASDRGTMYIKAVTLAAIWCAPEAAVPMRATYRAIRVNEVISTRIDRLAGTPSCVNWSNVGPWGLSSLRQICAGAYKDCVRSSIHPTPHRKKLTTKVAQAHPTTPMGASPRPPKVNQMDSDSLTSSDTAWSQVTNCGLPSAWLTVLKTRNSKAAGRLHPTMAR
ncbi:hypothetical protein D3C72_1423640 [compost metagenome]